MNRKHPEYQYLNLLKEIKERGVKNVDEGTGAMSWSVFGRQIRFDLSKGFPLLTTKKVYWKGVLEELYWFLSGNNNVSYLASKNVHIWNDYPYKIYTEKAEQGKVIQMSKEEFVDKLVNDKKFARKWGVLPRIYGELWRHWPAKDGRTIDQVQWVVDELKADPFARNTIVNSWNPEYLYSMAKPKEASRFPICHNMYQVSIKDDKLYLQLYQRSADMFLGVPFNIASYALLTFILAKVLGVKPGEFIHTFGDAHIYDNHMKQVEEQLARTPRPFPTLTIADEVKEIDDFLPEHALLEGYDPHESIKGELTVAGGVKKRDLKKR